MEDSLMQFVVIITIVIGLSLLITLIRQKFFNNKPNTPPDEADLLHNPISHATPQEKHEPGENTVPIYKLSNIVEANTLKALLEDNGIDCMLHSFYDSAYDGLWQAQKGWGVLKVLDKDQAKAEDLINEFLKAKDQTDESTPNELSQATPIPADKPILPGIIFTVALVTLIGIVVLILIGIFSAYRDSGRKLAQEGYDYSINNEYDKAIEYYDKAISRWYREPWVYNNRGYERYIKGDLDNAIKDYDKAIELDPKHDLAYGNRSCAKYAKGDYVGSLMDCEQAIKINPRDAMAWANKGAALNSLSKYNEALKALDWAIKLDPNDDPAWDNKGYALGQLGRHEEALAAFNKSIELNPDSVYAWNNKGYTLSKLGRYEESLKVLDKAVELDPKSVDAWDNKAYVLGRLGRYEESFKAFDKAIALDPKNAVIWYNRACIYSFKKEKQNVFDGLKKAISLDAKLKPDVQKDEDFKWLWDDEEFKNLTE